MEWEDFKKAIKREGQLKDQLNYWNLTFDKIVSIEKETQTIERKRKGKSYQMPWDITYKIKLKDNREISLRRIITFKTHLWLILYKPLFPEFILVTPQVWKMVVNLKHVCPKCGGSGFLPQYKHYKEGVCFQCNGTGQK